MPTQLTRVEGSSRPPLFIVWVQTPVPSLCVTLLTSLVNSQNSGTLSYFFCYLKLDTSSQQMFVEGMNQRRILSNPPPTLHFLKGRGAERKRNLQSFSHWKVFPWLWGIHVVERREKLWETLSFEERVLSSLEMSMLDITPQKISPFVDRTLSWWLPLPWVLEVNHDNFKWQCQLNC